MTEAIEIAVTINGRAHRLNVAPRRVLADVLREDLQLLGCKIGCDQAVCGACTVLVDEMPVTACTTFAFEVDRKTVITIEGLAEGGGLDPVQRAFLEHGAFQCGFCTPGMILSVKALLARHPEPDEALIRQWLSANISRCTGYQMIVEAVRAAAKERARLMDGAASPFRAPVIALDGPDKVTGAARYTFDVSLPGMLHAKVLRSPHPHARIRSIDTGRAEGLPGVAAVVTGIDAVGLPDPYYGVAIRDQPVVAIDKVRYVGDMVAAVAAVDEEIAYRALALIEVHYDPLPAVTAI